MSTILDGTYHASFIDSNSISEQNHSYACPGHLLRVEFDAESDEDYGDEVVNLLMAEIEVEIEFKCVEQQMRGIS